jgi:hypothetical protein
MTAIYNFTATVSLGSHGQRELDFVARDYHDNDSVLWAEAQGREGRGAWRIGAGTKLHGDQIRLVGYVSLDAARKVGWRGEPTAEAHGRFWFAKRDGTIRNRSARLVGWADEAAPTARATAQNYYGSL